MTQKIVQPREHRLGNVVNQGKLAAIRGSIVLAGGLSQRMGRAKAWLPFGGEALLIRVLRILQPLVSCQIVVAAVGQELPELPAEVRVARDRQPGRGPLEGLRAGLAEGQGRADVFYATACDVPLLQPRFVERMFDELTNEYDIVVPCDERRVHPLAGVYRSQVLPAVEDLLEDDRLRTADLCDRIPTRRLPTVRLREVDADLLSLTNVNTLDDYQRALCLAGYLAE